MATSTQSYNLIEKTNLISLFTMNTINNISVSAVSKVSTLAALFSQYNYTIDNFSQSSEILVSVDDAACLATESFRNALKFSNESAKIEEKLNEQIYDFEVCDGMILRIENDEASIIERVNALIDYLYEENDEDIADCTSIISTNHEDIVKGIYDFFNFETVFEVTVIESSDKKHIIIALITDSYL